LLKPRRSNNKPSDVGGTDDGKSGRWAEGSSIRTATRRSGTSRRLPLPLFVRAGAGSNPHAGPCAGRPHP
jgi:hypothetical protein